MPPCPVPPQDHSLRTLSELFLFTHAARDKLEQLLDHSERLAKAVSAVYEAAVLGKPPPLARVLELQDAQARLLRRLSKLQQRAEGRTQALSLEFAAGPWPSALDEEQLSPMMGLLEALVLLDTLDEDPGAAAKAAFAALLSAVLELTRAAMRDEDLAVPLGLLEAERQRALPYAADRGLGELRAAMDALG